MYRKTITGVTLIELLTVIVVLAVLASIAIPSYRSYVMRAQRADAKTALLQLQAAQEKFYLQHNRYTDNVTAAPPVGLGLTATSEHGFYNIRVELPEDDDQSYTAFAEAAPGKGQDADKRCTTFTLTDRGLRGADPGSSEYCWK